MKQEASDINDASKQHLSRLHPQNKALAQSLSLTHTHPLLKSKMRNSQLEISNPTQSHYHWYEYKLKKKKSHNQMKGAAYQLFRLFILPEQCL